MIKAILNLFRRNNTEVHNVVVEIPQPNFNRQMTVIEVSKKEESDDDN